MFANRKKTGAVLDAGKPEKSILRLLRADSGFQAYNVGSERTGFEEPKSGSYKESMNALLRAENLRGKVEMSVRNSRSFC